MNIQKDHLRNWSFWFILIGLLVFAVPTRIPSVAQEGATPVAPANVIPTPIRVTPPVRGAALLSKVQAGGQVRVIVDLNVNFIPEGRLVNPAVETTATSQAVRSQRAQLAQTKISINSLLSSHNAHMTASWDGLPDVAVTTDAGGLQALLNSPLVKQVYEDVAVPPTMGYSLPLIHASSTGGAWDQGVDGTGFTVAVLDTGTFSSHEFLSGKVVAEACFSSNGSGNSSLCPGGATSSFGSGAASPYARCVDLAGASNCEHGTHVAGIVAGKWGYYTSSSLIQPIDMGGVARGANLIPIQVFTYILDCDPVTAGNQPCVASWTSDQISAINYVYNTLASVGPGAGPYNISSINLSLGGGRYSGSNCDSADPAEQAALANLRSVGIAPVIASGNDGFVSEMGAPGCLSAAVSVGATEINYLSGPISTFITPNWPTNAWCQANAGGVPCYGSGVERIAYFSNSSPALELLAPGYYIESSILGTSNVVTNEYGLLPGTSMAAPHVAGAWAILKQQSPVAPVNRILATLQDTGFSINDSPYTGNSIAFPPAQLTFRSGATGTTFRRIDVGAAVLQLGLDFGDAPNSYGTLNASDGARHIRVPEYYLGSTADSESDGTPDISDGDDGVRFPAMIVGTTVNLNITASVAQTTSVPASYLGRLYAWIDYNRDGDFADAGEQAINGVTLTGPYPQAVPVAIPPGASIGLTWARFRYSTQPGLSYIGQAYNGEVEDYAIPLVTAVPVRNVYHTSTPTLSWNAVRWAAGYKVQVDKQMTFVTPLDYHDDDVPADKLTVTTDQLENGQYYWRVCAKKANGTCGPWSAIDTFVVDTP